MNKTEKVLTAILIALVLMAAFFCITPVGVALRNSYGFAVQKVDDATRYETRKKVEDTCRAMIANYEADRISYEQYKQSDDAEKQGWAEQAKMRANRTAASYNEYYLKNSFVWSGAVPSDIRGSLPYLE
ncbi:MAG: hypothetical protein EOM01_10485 [Spirochaetia bacterium]|nr:hypothetical protein [Spirochaetia bacterium]